MPLRMVYHVAMSGIDVFEQYEPLIDFVYTTLLMIWGGSLVGIGLLAVPVIFREIASRDEASRLTTTIFRRQDLLIRFVVITMLLLFYFKRELGYTYQYFEWGVYVGVLHFYIFGRVASKRLMLLRESISTFDAPLEKDPKRKRFRTLHLVVRYMYIAQVIGVILLLCLHAWGH